MNTKGKITYGDVEVSDDILSPEATRIRISIMIPGDVLDGIRAMAAKEGIKYQTLINKLLRDAVAAGSIVDRVERLERKVFEPRARKAG